MNKKLKLLGCFAMGLLFLMAVMTNAYTQPNEEDLYDRVRILEKEVEFLKQQLSYYNNLYTSRDNAITLKSNIIYLGKTKDEVQTTSDDGYDSLQDVYDDLCYYKVCGQCVREGELRIGHTMFCDVITTKDGRRIDN